jgi:hypothetical protein
MIANGSERSERGISNRGRLLKGEVGWLGQKIALRGTRVLGEGALAPAEYHISRLKPLDVSAGCLNLASYIEPWYLPPGR